MDIHFDVVRYNQDGVTLEERNDVRPEDVEQVVRELLARCGPDDEVSATTGAITPPTE